MVSLRRFCRRAHRDGERIFEAESSDAEGKIRQRRIGRVGALQFSRRAP